MARRFETVRVGVMEALPGALFDLRIVLLHGAGTAHLVTGGALGEPHPSAAAVASDAEATLPGVSWRDDFRARRHERACPICASPSFSSERYPRTVCFVCVLEAVDDAGNELSFANIDMSGGFRATRADGSEARTHECTIRGVPCWADEARFGGIIVRRIEDLPR